MMLRRYDFGNKKSLMLAAGLSRIPVVLKTVQERA